MLFSGGRAIPLSVPLGSGNVARRLPRSTSVRFLPVTVSKVRPCREPRDVASNLERYLTEREPTARYASFDYCYNYFQTYRERANVSAVAATANMELSCLHLGFYLASWGMLRGSTDLLQRSIKHLEPVVTAIAGAPPALWEIDANDYSDEVWTTLGGFNADLCAILSGKASDTLTTKIMLGTFGCVPAFDTNFVRAPACGSSAGPHSDVSSCSTASMRRSSKDIVNPRSTLPRTGTPTASTHGRRSST